MRQFDRSSAESAPIGDVDVWRWEQFGLGDKMPFQAMWYTVPPGSSPAQDHHPELELSVVLSGTASVEVGGEVIDMPAGTSFLFDSYEAHIIHNRSADEPLVVFSAYWMPKEQAQ
jgi:mannose-6-phosphate isomerase-like protein (cupin superfamily)